MGSRDFYLEVVLPALAECLDQAFPEFGWRRDAHGWVATNEEHTHRCVGVCAERVIAHGPAPRGFLVHGGDATLWTAYAALSKANVRGPRQVLATGEGERAPIVADALTAAWALNWPDDRAEALAAYAFLLPVNERPSVLVEALRLAEQATEYADSRAKGLARLAPP